MNKASLLRRAVRPRNIVLGVGITAPLFYFLAFAKDREGNPKRARYWQVKAYELFPLRAASRLWGQFNSINLPVWFRPYGFRLYSWLFGVDLTEMADPDLTHYANLGEFFYRALNPNARPIAQSSLMVCPCDGKVLQFGQLQDNSHIEQVKGINYTVDRFLGDPKEAPHLPSPMQGSEKGDSATVEPRPHEVTLRRHEKFAELNGLDYTVDEIVGDETHEKNSQGGTTNFVDKGDAAVEKKALLDTPMWLPIGDTNNRLFYCVIYLAPGDYHRFHSPVPWVVSLRRHFVGELFSVAPYFQNRLADLFCLNERVALLGKWKHGFFSMTPVGATNVGSIIINFDKFLKTNQRGAAPRTCYEASFSSASPIYRGYPLKTGEEMGGFRLGSTVVLVFEAPENFHFKVARNSVVKMGEPLGDVIE